MSINEIYKEEVCRGLFNQRHGADAIDKIIATQTDEDYLLELGIDF